MAARWGRPPPISVDTEPSEATSGPLGGLGPLARRMRTHDASAQPKTRLAHHMNSDGTPRDKKPQGCLTPRALREQWCPATPQHSSRALPPPSLPWQGDRGRRRPLRRVGLHERFHRRHANTVAKVAEGLVRRVALRAPHREDGLNGRLELGERHLKDGSSHASAFSLSMASGIVGVSIAGRMISTRGAVPNTFGEEHGRVPGWVSLQARAGRR
eukprot:scaffold52223_cov30-Tisochrysis_lutea.AAC.7